MSGSNVARCERQSDGGVVWSIGERVIARISVDNDGLWSVLWRETANRQRRLGNRFSSLHTACLAAEKCWPEGLSANWVESAEGGYFRQFGRSRVRVRQTVRDWYAVRDDGKVLAKAGEVLWFASADEAMAAVERHHYTRFEADPFRDTHDRLTWLTIKRRRAA
jgi:hypothetical protein